MGVGKTTLLMNYAQKDIDENEMPDVVDIDECSLSVLDFELSLQLLDTTTSDVDNFDQVVSLNQDYSMGINFYDS